MNSPSQVAYATNEGNMYMFDGRNPSKPMFKQCAHNKAEVTDIVVSDKNLCYTSSDDGTVKIWNLENVETPIAMRNPKCGKLFCMDLYESETGPVLSAGNANG